MAGRHRHAAILAISVTRSAWASTAPPRVPVPARWRSAPRSTIPWRLPTCRPISVCCHAAPARRRRFAERAHHASAASKAAAALPTPARRCSSMREPRRAFRTAVNPMRASSTPGNLCPTQDLPVSAVLLCLGASNGAPRKSATSVASPPRRWWPRGCSGASRSALERHARGWMPGPVPSPTRRHARNVRRAPPRVPAYPSCRPALRTPDEVSRG